jgi:hypothetical protein
MGLPSALPPQGVFWEVEIEHMEGAERGQICPWQESLQEREAGKGEPPSYRGTVPGPASLPTPCSCGHKVTTLPWPSGGRWAVPPQIFKMDRGMTVCLCAHRRDGTATYTTSHGRLEHLAQDTGTKEGSELL